jgi:tetratricopeptide (TPR) repeat protein
VAVHKAAGRATDAIAALNNYLNCFQNDADAWHELAEIYISQHQHASALFCYEELILTNPHNFHYHLKYAELLYTVAIPKPAPTRADDFETARKYFIQAVELNPDGVYNCRARYGVLMVSASLRRLNPKRQSETDVAVFDWASKKLASMNQAGAQDGEMKKVLANTLEALQTQ